MTHLCRSALDFHVGAEAELRGRAHAKGCLTPTKDLAMPEPSPHPSHIEPR